MPRKDCVPTVGWIVVGAALAVFAISGCYGNSQGGSSPPLPSTSAIGAIGALHRQGLRVPGDISVVGFDDIEISAALYPPLTTVRLSRASIADRAFHALFSANREPGARGAEYLVQPELVVRDTTAVRVKMKEPLAKRGGRKKLPAKKPSR